MAQAGHIPKIGKDPSSHNPIRGFQGTQQWSHLVTEADLIVLTSNAIEIAPHLQKARLGPKSHVLVFPGIESGTGLWMSDYVQQHSHALRVGVLNGAISLNDIKQDRPTAMVVASVYNSVGTLGREVFHSDICRIYYSHDPLGVEVYPLYFQKSFLPSVLRAINQGPATTGAVASRGLLSWLAKVLGLRNIVFGFIWRGQHCQ